MDPILPSTLEALCWCGVAAVLAHAVLIGTMSWTAMAAGLWLLVYPARRLFGSTSGLD